MCATANATHVGSSAFNTACPSGRLRFEQPALGIRVVLERVVTVQMIGRDVRADARSSRGTRRSFRAGSSTARAHSTVVSRDATIAVGGVPMLPPTWQGIPHSFRMWPISAVVVVLPFEPVMPQTGPRRK